MLTWLMWGALGNECDEIELLPLFVFCGNCLSFFTIPIDVILSPIEIISFIIYKIIERRNK